MRTVEQGRSSVDLAQGSNRALKLLSVFGCRAMLVEIHSLDAHESAGEESR